MFCLCAALAICCETFRTTVLQTSKAPNHTDMTLREAEGILLTRACLPGPPWALSVSSSPRPDDSCLLPGEGRVGCVWLKMSLLRRVGNEDRKSTASHLYWTRSPDTYGKCQDCHCSWFFGFFFWCCTGPLAMHLSMFSLLVFGRSSIIIQNATVNLGRLWDCSSMCFLCWNWFV